MYEYKAEVIDVVDGDTVHADIDLGFDTHTHMTLRLNGIDAPEMKTQEGKDAKEYLTLLLAPTHGNVTLKTVKDHREKYGRYLATLYGRGNMNLNETMVETGHAKRYKGGKR